MVYIGNYFSTHFIMGGERFETPQPEQYLFGENSDLNFFSGKPLPVITNIIKKSKTLLINNFFGK